VQFPAEAHDTELTRASVFLPAFAGSDAWTPVPKFADANACGGTATNINNTPHATGGKPDNTRRRCTPPRAREQASALGPTLAAKPSTRAQSPPASRAA
jgi:hypothetical protein